MNKTAKKMASAWYRWFMTFSFFMAQIYSYELRLRTQEINIAFRRSYTYHRTMSRQKRTIISLSLFLFASLAAIGLFFNEDSPTTHEMAESIEKHGPEMAPGFYEQWRTMKKDENGEIPTGLRSQWYEADQSKSYKRAPNTGLRRIKEIGPNNIGGRTRDMLIDAANPKRILACAVSGGLWETKNNGSSWKQINDFSPSLAVTCITQCPFDYDVIYYGTGEPIGNSSGVAGDGIFKSIDGGKTFKQLDSTLNGDFNYIWDIEHSPIDSNTIYVSTNNKGVFRSQDAGLSFHKVFESGTDVHDIEILPDGTVILAVESRGVYRSETGNALTYFKMTNGLPTVAYNRLEVESCDSFPNVVYALFSKDGPSYTGYCVGLWKSSDSGVNWKFMGNPNDDVRGGFTFPWYTLALGVDPADTNKILAGSATFTYSINGGANWRRGNLGHADHHVYVFRPDAPGSFYSGNDGGIYEYNWSTISTRYVDKNNGYNVTQFYAGSFTPDSLGAIAGTQDNGTNYTGFGKPEFNEVWGGDGAFCHIHQQSSSTAYVSSQNGNIRKTGNVGVAFPSTISIRNNLDANNDGTIDDGAWFIQPFEMNYLDGNQLFFPARNRLWYSFDGGGSWYEVSSFKSGLYSVGIPNEERPYRVYFGGDNLALWRQDDLSNPVPGEEVWLKKTAPNGLSSGFISSITVHPQDDGIIYIGLSNYANQPRVWRIEDADTDEPEWVDISGDLPQRLPANWIVVDPYRPDSVFFIGTDFGLYTTRNAGTNWVKEERIPNVSIHNLRLRYTDRKLFIYTHGRGIFTADLEYAAKPSDTTSIAPKPISQLDIYPNPAVDVINIPITEQFNYRIIDHEGREVAHGRASNLVEVSTLVPGVYILELQSEEKQYRQQFVKS